MWYETSTGVKATSEVAEVNEATCISCKYTVFEAEFLCILWDSTSK